MNFFGHAVVACWFNRDPAFVLGAMLPDLRAMLGVRPSTPRSAALVSGVALHHATDAAFHDNPVFLALSRDALRTLAARGLGRGPSRALAHVGVEILLDETLGRDPRDETAYLAALALAAGEGLAGEAAVEPLRDLAGRLAQRGILRSPPAELVARRLYHALASHPRLVFPLEQEPVVTSWVTETRPLVTSRADELVAELRGRLLPSFPASTA